MAKICEMEGIGRTFANKLQTLGIDTTEALLQKGATPSARRHISSKTGIDEALLLRWVNHADLLRIQGLVEEYADLLRAAGIASVRDLRRQKQDLLHSKLMAISEATRLIHRVPTRDQIGFWIREAKGLSRLVTL